MNGVYIQPKILYSGKLSTEKIFVDLGPFVCFLHDCGCVEHNIQSVVNLYISLICESFLPRQFPARRYKA